MPWQCPQRNVVPLGCLNFLCRKISLPDCEDSDTNTELNFCLYNVLDDTIITDLDNVSFCGSALEWNISICFIEHYSSLHLTTLTMLSCVYVHTHVCVCVCLCVYVYIGAHFCWVFALVCRIQRTTLGVLFQVPSTLSGDKVSGLELTKKPLGCLSRKLKGPSWRLLPSAWLLLEDHS